MTAASVGRTWIASLVLAVMLGVSVSSGLVSTAHAPSPSDDTSDVPVPINWVDGGSLSERLGPVALPDNEHAAEICVVDLLGCEEDVRSAEVLADTVPPEAEPVPSGTVNVQSWMEETWYISDVSVEIVATDDASGVLYAKYRIDNGDWRSYLSPVIISTDGLHVFECYAVDVAGNTGEVSSVTVGIDRVSPVVTIIGFTTEDGVTSMNYVASDGTSGVHHMTVSVDGGDAVVVDDISTVYVIQGLDSGSHEVNATVYDNAGNSASASSEFGIPEAKLLTSGQLYVLVALVSAVLLAALLLFLMRNGKGRVMTRRNPRRRSRR